uniref:Protein unc-80 n=1 Tax=Lygus hesperus TaxID=30085 RepID=A0A0A9WDH9_LYGHE
MCNQILVTGYLQMTGVLKQIFGQGYRLKYPGQSTLYEDTFLPSWITFKTKTSFDDEVEEKDFDFVTICEVFGTNGRQGAIYLYRKINSSIITGADRVGNQQVDNTEQVIYMLENLMNKYVSELRALNGADGGATVESTTHQYINIHKSIEESVVGELLKLQFASLHIHDVNTHQDVKLILCDHRANPVNLPRPLGFPNLGVTYHSIVKLPRFSTMSDGETG